MPKHKIYRAIVKAVESGNMIEPFRAADFRITCPGFGKGTYGTFLSKHAACNGKYTELFVRVERGRYSLIRPYKYGL